MKKQKSSIENIFHESIVVDYVAGHLNEKERANFEKMLTSDAGLQNAVQIETQLRETLASLENADGDPVSNRPEGLNKLLSKLDEISAQEADQKQAAQFAPRNRFAYAGIAASFAFALLFVYLPSSEPTANFALLSDQSDATQNNFDDLVKQHRVAQVWPNEGLQKQQLTALFSKYQLTPISRAGQAWVVTATQALSSEQLTKLAAVEGFKQIRLVSFDNTSDQVNNQ